MCYLSKQESPRLNEVETQAYNKLKTAIIAYSSKVLLSTGVPKSSTGTKNLFHVHTHRRYVTASDFGIPDCPPRLHFITHTYSH